MNNRYTLAAVVVAASVVMVFGILFVYRSLPVVLSLRRHWTRPEPPMDKVILAKESFSKSVYYQDPGLGVITDIETTGGNSMVLVGQSGAVFLNSNLQPRGIAYYPTCTSEMTFVNWSTGAFSVADRGVQMLPSTTARAGWSGRTAVECRASIMRLQATSMGRKR